MALSLPASAYVRARTTNTFAPFFWRDPAQVLEVATPPDGLGISTNDLRNAARAAVDSWSYPKIACTAVSLRLTAETSDSQVAGLDGSNRIIMRVGQWCRDPVAMTVCHDSNIVALTTIFTTADPGSPDDGEFVEADIEMNAVDYSWAMIPDGPTSGRDFFDKYDLTSVLTHETGHFIGLGHTCRVSVNSQLLIDDQGADTPECDFLPPDTQTLIEDATMYPMTNLADVKLRSLTADDKRAACEIYPMWSAPTDDWAGGAGCQIASTSRHASWPQGGAIVLALGLILRRRRPRGRAARQCRC